MIWLLLAFVGSAAAFSADFSSKEWKERPVAKVVNLLKEMGAQLQKEQDNDQEIYDAMACWCETGEKAKTKAIADAQQHTLDLNSAVEEGGAKSAQLTVDIEELNKEIASNQDALSRASAIRAQEMAEFNQDEKNAITSISGLKNAVLTLGKHHDSLSQEAMVEIQHTLKQHLGKGSERVLRRLLTPLQSRRLSSFLQQSSAAQDSAPASGEIFGVLQGMKESFQSNLASAQSEEATSLKAFEQLKSAKTQELAAGRMQVDNKAAELADTREQLANDRTDRKETGAQLDADQAFLADLKSRCGSMDSQWEARQKVRGEEMQAVSEALSILSEDDARDLMSKTTTSLLQVSVVKRQRARDRAVQVLLTVAQKNSNPRLSALAVMMKTNVFTKVKQAIDGMTVQLKKEAQDEIKHRDFCTEELHQNEKQTTTGYETKADLETHIEDLKASISTLTDSIAVASAEIAETQVEMKRASENREKANKEFQMAVADQRATQEILQKALTRLQDFYAKKDALVQTKSVAAKNGQAPPQGFGGDYKKSGGANGVMGMIDNIISDSKQVEAEATKAEQDSQSAYEEFIKDSNKSVSAMNEEIATKANAKAKHDEDRINAEADFKATMSTLQELNDMAGNLHMSCDFTMKNFDTRQAARNEEVDALTQAKAILSGADM